MRIKPLLPLLVTSLLLVSTLLSPSARTQQRGLGTGAAQPAGVGRYYALVIGNNAYTSLPRLKTAEADARAVAALLKDYYGFETNLLLNATRGKIVSALSSYRRSLGPDANLLIYYAGHGVNDADKAYWLPVDAERDDTANWIIADEITQTLKVIPARHVLVVSDSCYSGTLTRGLGEALPRATEREQFLQRMAAGRSRTLMASGGDEPVADGGGDGRHSVFANALLRGLQVMDKARFTGAELFRYHVEESVAGRANQTPEYNPLKNSGHESGDFIFVRVKVGDKTVEVTVKVPPAGVIDPAAFELEYWNAIKTCSDPEEYRGYL
ncbi:MAG: caspase family protein, partial [Acidobacteriota bacterium]|nr:caspase family protein [Acidobacteriota bacterium]